MHWIHSGLFVGLAAVSTALASLFDGGAAADPLSETQRVIVALLGKAATCFGASAVFCVVKRVLCPDFDINAVIHGTPPFDQRGEDLPRAAYILGWSVLYGAIVMAFAWGGAY